MKRPSWNEYFMQIAELVSSRSTCLRRQVGAIIVKDKNILSTGYNGVPSGIVHCRETGCLRNELKIPSGERHEICRGLHAEQNAIIQAAKHGVKIEGSIIYSTVQPCNLCSKMIINAGIKKVFLRQHYPEKYGEQALKDAGIEVEIVTPEKN